MKTKVSPVQMIEQVDSIKRMMREEDTRHNEAMGRLLEELRNLQKLCEHDKYYSWAECKICGKH